MAKRNSEGEGLDKQIPEDGWNRVQIVIVGKYTTTEWLSSPWRLAHIEPERDDRFHQCLQPNREGASSHKIGYNSEK